MRQNLTQQVFDATAATYDRDRMRLIPCHERFYGSALSLIPQAAVRIADLGAGSGLFSAMVRQIRPEADLHLVDFSAPMLELAKQRLGDNDHIHYGLADYTIEPLLEHCDAIVSALSIHHLEDDRKQAILPKIMEALNPGGVFVNADHIAGPTTKLELEYQQRWLTAIREAGATEQQIADSLYRQQEDRRSPVDVQLAWMREAGFVDVDCWFKDGSFAVMTGRRPADENAQALTTAAGLPS